MEKVRHASLRVFVKWGNGRAGHGNVTATVGWGNGRAGRIRGEGREREHKGKQADLFRRRTD